MEIIRGLHNLKKLPGCVLTVGNFDGVHVGHQEILKNLVNKAKEQGVCSLVISFSVTPQTFFGRPQARISNFREKHLLLKALGVDKHLLIRFNKKFSEISAGDFINKVLIEKINMKHCFVGDDFRFGSGREGNYSMLEKASINNNFTVQKINDISINKHRISSTKIRRRLQTGTLKPPKLF